MPNQEHPYFEQLGVLTSKHEKLRLVAPSFEKLVGLEIVEVELDTDQLGTFSGEVEREFPPLETAIRKARLGMGETGLPIGLASEGSIGPDPLVPFLTSDIEHLVLVDDERELIISELFRSFEIVAVSVTAHVGQDLSDFLAKADFPHHKLIVKPRSGDIAESVKGIDTFQDLMLAIEKCALKSHTGAVLIESDFRAQSSPSRQRNIERVSQALAARVNQLCPACHTPGWGRVDFEKGVPCAMCKSVVAEAVHREIIGCQKCSLLERGPVLSASADPAICPWCNP